MRYYPESLTHLRIDFETPKNKMAAATALNELEKAITYGLLAAK